MEIAKKNIASIKQNAMSGNRVSLSIAEEDGVYSIITSAGEKVDGFESAESAEYAIYELYGAISDWDLRYNY